MKQDKITVLYYGLNAEPVEMEIENTLEAKQKLVEGFIEFVSLERYGGPQADAVVNEEGKFIYPLNVSLDVYDYIAGPFIVVGPADEEGNCTSLTPELISQTKKFFKADWFANV